MSQLCSSGDLVNALLARRHFPKGNHVTVVNVRRFQVERVGAGAVLQLYVAWRQEQTEAAAGSIHKTDSPGCRQGDGAGGRGPS